VSQIVNNWLHAHGIDHTLHTARHYFGTKVYAASSDLRLTQELMGHSNPGTTAGYTAWSPEKGASVHESLSVGR
jgi:site-specific recombinase XerC